MPSGFSQTLGRGPPRGLSSSHVSSPSKLSSSDPRGLSPINKNIGNTYHPTSPGGGWELQDWRTKFLDAERRVEKQASENRELRERLHETERKLYHLELDQSLAEVREKTHFMHLLVHDVCLWCTVSVQLYPNPNLTLTLTLTLTLILPFSVFSSP